MGLSDATANVILLLLTLVAIVMSFVWGFLVDRRGPKQTLVWVLVSWAVGLILGGDRDRLRAVGPAARSSSRARSSAAASAASRSRTAC